MYPRRIEAWTDSPSVVSITAKLSPRSIVHDPAEVISPAVRRHLLCPPLEVDPPGDHLELPDGEVAAPAR